MLKDHSFGDLGAIYSAVDQTRIGTRQMLKALYCLQHQVKSFFSEVSEKQINLQLQAWEVRCLVTGSRHTAVDLVVSGQQSVPWTAPLERLSLQ